MTISCWLIQRMFRTYSQTINIYCTKFKFTAVIALKIKRYNFWFLRFTFSFLPTSYHRCLTFTHAKTKFNVCIQDLFPTAGYPAHKSEFSMILNDCYHLFRTKFKRTNRRSLILLISSRHLIGRGIIN